MADLRRTVIPMMLLGDSQVGKTALIKRITGNVFEDSQLTTIGKESYVYQTKLHDNDLKIKIWDTAGQERFKSMSVNVIKNVEGLILTYSIINRESFQNMDSWLQKLNDASDLSKKPVIIVGNKIDLEEKRQVTTEEGEEFAKNHGYNFFEVSAKTGKNVKEAFYDIFEQLYKIFEEEITGKKVKKPKLELKKETKKKKRFC
jgi:small GTP-binding protein